ncbi:cAMP-binding domain of CRP or a regulatory subunit of cAMP-dependent protein kinases [Donghicola eburneus]|nr:cAMP-binding domain of CRP or a regulatory subunit of cAMP-dependent protein kinases [Donghicola eburneus]
MSPAREGQHARCNVLSVHLSTDQQTSRVGASMVRGCAFCHHEVVLLVMRPDGHQAKETKSLNLSGIAIDTERHAIFEFLRDNVPAGFSRKKGRMGGHHGADGFENTGGAPNLEPGPFRPQGAGDHGLLGQKIHIDQMAAQSVDIDPLPICLGIGLQDRNDLRQGGKGRLPGFLRSTHVMASRGMGVLSGHGCGHQYGKEEGNETHGRVLQWDAVMFTLAGAGVSQYDCNHMLPAPYDLIPSSALRPFSGAVGDIMFHQGGPTHGLYVVQTGRVYLERVGPDGERFIIHRAQAGTSFAEASVFSEVYHCDAVFVQAGTLIRIEKDAVLDAFADPEFARAFGRQAAQQIQAQRQMLEIVGIRRAEDRVLAGLVAGLLDGSVIEFAARLQLSHEATYRALRKLVQDGRVKNPARGIYHLRP